MARVASFMISILILLFASALKTPYPKAPKEPPPWSIKTFSMVLGILEYSTPVKCHFMPHITVDVDCDLIDRVLIEMICRFILQDG